MPLLPRSTPSKSQQQQLQQQRKKSPLAAAGALVCDTITATPDVARRQAQAVKQFKVSRCTPRRQRAAATEALVAEMDEFEARQKQRQEQEQLHRSPSSTRGRIVDPAGSTHLSSSSSFNVPTHSDTSGRASPATMASPSASGSPSRHGAAAAAAAVSPSAISMSTGIYVNLATTPARALVYRGGGGAVSLPVSSSPSSSPKTALEMENRRVNLSAVKGDIEAFTMKFASDQERYEKIRSQITSPNKKKNSVVDVSAASPSPDKKQSEQHQHKQQSRDNDSDRSSSTDSIIIDPAVMGVATSRSSTRRNARLRDHFSLSLDTLNHTSAIGVNGSSSSRRGGQDGGSSPPSTGESCVLLSYLAGLERLVNFSLTTLSSKEELAALVAVLSSFGGLQETAQSFGRWPCFRQETLDMRLEKVLPGILDRRALFECMAGALRDGRVVHAALLAGLRLVYYSPSAPHFLEFLVTVLFVHQINLTQGDCQTIYRFLTTPHPLRFLARGRIDIPAEQLLEAAVRKAELEAVSAANATASALEASLNGVGSLEMSLGGSLSTMDDVLSSSGSQQQQQQQQAAAQRRPSSSSVVTTRSASFVSKKQQQQALVKKQLQEVQAQQRKKLLAGLTSPALDVDRKVAAEELYFLLDFLGTSTTQVTWSWTDLKSLVTPDDGTAAGGGGLTENLSFTSTGSSGGGGAAAGVVDVAILSNPKEAEKFKLHQMQQLRRHEQAIAARRRTMAEDVYAGATRLQKMTDCVVLAKLMSELKAP